MPIPAETNKPINVTFTPTLDGAPGKLDVNSPFEVVLTPPENGSITNVVLAPDGTKATMDLTMTVLGDTQIATKKADGNLAAGMIDVVVTDTVQTVEAIQLGANGGTFAVTPVA